MKIGGSRGPISVQQYATEPAPQAATPAPAAPSSSFVPGKPVGPAAKSAPTDSIISPEPGRSYPVQSSIKGRAVQVDVKFDDAAVAWLRSNGAKIDLSTAEIVSRTDKRYDLAVVKERHLKDAGEPAPPWMVFEPLSQLYGVPRGELRVTVEDDTFSLGWDNLENGFDFYPDNHTPVSVPLPAMAYQPLSLSDFPATLQLTSDARVTAATPALAQQAKALFDTVCGPSVAADPKSRERLEREQAEVKDTFAKLKALGVGPELTQLINDVKARYAPSEDAAWGYVDALGALRARYADLKEQLLPVELVVVPAGKHYSAMPQLDACRQQILDLPQGVAANVTTSDRRYVFMPEGDDGTSLHELYHLLQTRYLPPSTLAKIDAIYDATLAAGGPFAREYGVQKAEFVTTMSELFEGGSGPSGVEWLKAKQPVIYEIFCDATGRRP